MRRKLIGIYIIIILVTLVFLLSCTTQYIPIEPVRTEIVHQHDSVKQTDSVKNEIRTIIRESRPEDSLMLRELGIKLQANERLLILLQKELQQAKSEKQESHNRDSARTESIRVPYPVERKLSRWEQVKMDYGAVSIGVSLAAIIAAVAWLLIWIRRRI